MLPNIAKYINTVTIKNRLPLLSFMRHKAAYEGEGKTTVRVINQEYDLGLMIDSYATQLTMDSGTEEGRSLPCSGKPRYGFRLNNGLTVLGPMAIFPRTVLSWQVKEADEITEESLSLFKLLQPTIDLLVIGLESNDRSKFNSILKAARANQLNVEILPTEHACSTFNFLNAECRSVAAALIPPLKLEMNENDMLQSKIHYQDLFNNPLN